MKVTKITNYEDGSPWQGVPGGRSPAGGPQREVLRHEGPRQEVLGGWSLARESSTGGSWGEGSSVGPRQEGPREVLGRWSLVGGLSALGCSVGGSLAGPGQEGLLSVNIVCQSVSQHPSTAAVGGAGHGCCGVAGAVPNLFQSLAMQVGAMD